jgi:hypothetical protein
MDSSDVIPALFALAGSILLFLSRLTAGAQESATVFRPHPMSVQVFGRPRQTALTGMILLSSATFSLSVPHGFGIILADQTGGRQELWLSPASGGCLGVYGREGDGEGVAPA